MSDASSHQQPSSLLRAIGIAIVVVVVQALIIPLFAAPAANLAPRDLPIVIAGQPQVTAGLTAALERAEPGAFKIIQIPDAAAADQVLREREAYAAVVVEPRGASLHTAPGASPAVAALLVQASTNLGGGRPVPVVEVVPADPDDPRGTGFAAGFLPLALTGMIAGIALALLIQNRAAKLAGLVIFGVVAGLAGAGVLQLWLGLLPGDYLLNAGAIGLFATATSATLAGLGAALGRAGIILGVVAVFLVGNPLSGVGSAPELLPQPWGTVGQYLPPGAGASLLRSTAFFDGAAATMPLSVLLGYAVIGLALVLVGRATIGETRRQTTTTTPTTPFSDDTSAMAQRNG
jgi:hypothetical protein